MIHGNGTKGMDAEATVAAKTRIVADEFRGGFGWRRAWGWAGHGAGRGKRVTGDQRCCCCMMHEAMRHALHDLIWEIDVVAARMAGCEL
jgi:hypothetical protein